MQIGGSKLQTGEIVQLLVVGDDQYEHRMEVKYIGCFPPYTLLVSMPAKQRRIVIRPGLKLTVSLVTATGVASFSTTVDMLCQQPYPYLHLHYPTDIAVEDIRATSRVKTLLNANVVNLDDADDLENFSAKLIDISVLGGRLSADQLIGKVGNEITVHLRMVFAEFDQSITLNAIIRSCSGRVTEGARAHVYGIEFFELTEEKRALLYAYVLYQTQRVGTIKV